MKKTFLPLLLLLLLVALSIRSSAATWYLHANVLQDWNTLSIWYSQPLGGGTNPSSVNSSDNFDLNGYSVPTPGITSGSSMFGGNQLILHGGTAGYISFVAENPATIIIPNLTSYGGFLDNDAYSGILAVNITNFVNNANTTLGGGTSVRGMNFKVGTLSGTGDICAIGTTGNGAAGGAILLNTASATGFTGTLHIADGCQFTFNNAMTSGGALDVQGSGTTVNLNYTITFNGVTTNGIAIHPGTYSAASLGFSGTGSVVVQATNSASRLPVMQLFGVNLPGGGFASGSFYPTDPNEWAYYHGKGLNLIRVAFLWERLQPTLNGPLDSTALASLDTAVSLAAAQGMSVILDMHNYDYYSNYIIGSSQVPYSAFQNAWQQIAAHFAGKAGVYGYDLMNEPVGDNGTWGTTAAQYGVNGVRQSDTKHYVIVEGENYASAEYWMSASENLNVTDPANKLIYSAHIYFDSNYSGTYSGTYDSNNDYPNIGADRVAAFIYWLGLKGAKGYIGEFGVPNNVPNPDYRWNILLNNFLCYLNNSGVEGTYWSGGECWGTTYPLSCATGTPPMDAPAMSVLQNYGSTNPSGILIDGFGEYPTGTLLSFPWDDTPNITDNTNVTIINTSSSPGNPSDQSLQSVWVPGQLSLQETNLYYMGIVGFQFNNNASPASLQNIFNTNPSCNAIAAAVRFNWQNMPVGATYSVQLGFKTSLGNYWLDTAMPTTGTLLNNDSWTTLSWTLTPPQIALIEGYPLSPTYGDMVFALQTSTDVTDTNTITVGFDNIQAFGLQNPDLTITNSGYNIKLTWKIGTLLEATNLAGPWTTNANASPYTVPVTAPQTFYRVQ